MPKQYFSRTPRRRDRARPSIHPPQRPAHAIVNPTIRVQDVGNGMAELSVFEKLPRYLVEQIHNILEESFTRTFDDLHRTSQR